jgi:dephospho-CoA kinase
LIFLIGAKESIRFKRYKKKKGNYKIFKFLNNRQIKHKNKTKFADHVIMNDKSLGLLKKKLANIIENYE